MVTDVVWGVSPWIRAGPPKWTFCFHHSANSGGDWAGQIVKGFKGKFWHKKILLVANLLSNYEWNFIEWLIGESPKFECKFDEADYSPAGREDTTVGATLDRQRIKYKCPSFMFQSICFRKSLIPLLLREEESLNFPVGSWAGGCWPGVFGNRTQTAY